MKKTVDPNFCPKCGKQHQEPQSKITVCQECKEKVIAEKAIADKKKAEEQAKLEAVKRDPMFNPVKTVSDLTKVRRVEPGDVIACDKNGWYFFPKERDSTPDILKLLIPNVAIFCDWGGVASLFLEDEKRNYIKTPKKINKPIGKSAWIFSYTPTNKIKECEEMRLASSAAGFDGMIITTLKGVDDEGTALNELGKHQLMTALLKGWNHDIPNYYEDTAAVLDHLSEGDSGKNVNKFWVIPAGSPHREMKPKRDDIKGIEQKDFLNQIIKL